MWHDLFLISPLVIVTVVGLVALLAAVFTSKDSFKGWLGNLTTVGFVLAGVAALFLYGRTPEELAFESHVFNYAFAIDHFGLGLSIVVLIGAALMSLATVDYLKNQKADHGEFYGLVAFASVGMMALVMANDLLTFFIALELMSLSVYVLAGFKRQSQFSTESATKYFVLGSFASGLLLLGIGFAYGATGTLSLPGLMNELPGAMAKTPELVRFALILLVGAFFFKVAAAPFHMWTPDVYEGAPATAAGFMAIAVKTAAFGGFARLLLTGFGTPELKNDGLSWELLLVIGSVASMVIGNLMALAQKNLKRMLAYSAIAHTGYLMVALLVVPKGSAGALAGLGGGLVFYLLAYTLANAAAFGVAAAVSGNDTEDIGEQAYAGLAKRSPGHAFVLAIAMLSLLGIPLTAGFMGKLTIFEEILTTRSEYLWLVVVAVVNSVISAWYYLRVILIAYMREESTERPIALIQSRSLTISLGLAAIATVFVGILPSSAMNFSRTAGESLAGSGARSAARLLETPRVGAAAPTTGTEPSAEVASPALK